MINTIRQGLLEEDSRTFVFNEGLKRVSDSDVRVTAECYNVEPSDIMCIP
ncbi:hypothetical protein [Anaplasma phagocytophilum]|nr:hypothetical protein [Anaplasma phagocytophilum]